MFVVMTFNCISLIMATIVMNIKKRGDEKQCPDVPAWMLWVCHNILSKYVLCVCVWGGGMCVCVCVCVVLWCGAVRVYVYL